MGDKKYHITFYEEDKEIQEFCVGINVYDEDEVCALINWRENYPNAVFLSIIQVLNYK